MNTTLLIISGLVIIVYLLIKAELSDQRRQIYIFKPLATLLVISVAFMAFLQPNNNTLYTQFVLWGLLFSLGGDLALMFPRNRKAFSGGLGLFLTAHIIYSIGFFKLGGYSNWLMLPILILYQFHLRMRGILFTFSSFTALKNFTIATAMLQI